jgi:hypothetical protein
MVVTMKDSNGTQLSIELLDPMGRTYELVGELHDNNYITDVTGLPAGVYLFKIMNDHATYHVRFVKR